MCIQDRLRMAILKVVVTLCVCVCGACVHAHACIKVTSSLASMGQKKNIVGLVWYTDAMNTLVCLAVSQGKGSPSPMNSMPYYPKAETYVI
jgi:hypothetical protein